MTRLKRRLTWLRWRVRRWNKMQNCIAAHRHGLELQEVRGVAGSRCEWCRSCSSVHWVD